VNELHELRDFFAASIGAAAALIGLLFVAISVAPEQVFGIEADIDRRANAERAFTALSNVFFVSLVALLPHSPSRAIQVVAALAMAQTIRAGVRTFRGRPLRDAWRHSGIISLAAYAFQFYAARLMTSSDNATDNVVDVVLGLYGYALITSWGLLRLQPPADPPPADPPAA
jgi:hypothetical protein